MQAGRLNLIGNGPDGADEEAQMVTNMRQEFRRHNSNLNRPTLGIQDHASDNSGAIVEAGVTEEQTYRKGSNNMSYDEPIIMTTNNFMTENNFNAGGAMRLNHLKPSNSTAGIFTDTLGKRQGDISSKTMQAGNVEHRQKIFEEEIIKRIKEI
jgi:hypothetical protein